MVESGHSEGGGLRLILTSAFDPKPTSATAGTKFGEDCQFSNECFPPESLNSCASPYRISDRSISGCRSDDSVVDAFVR